MEALFEQGMPATHEDLEYVEHRVYHDYVATVDYDYASPIYEENSFNRNWVPYE
jgi:hypothetical protein